MTRGRIAALAGLVAAGALLLSGPAAAQPKLTVDGGTKLSLGSMKRGDVVDRTITLRNTGNATLELGNVEVSCGCTGAVTSSKSVAPGKTATVKITFNSKNFSGQVHKTVTILSNAPGQERTVVEFTADIREEVTVNPPQFLFMNAEATQVATASISIRNNGTTPLVIKGYRTALEGLTVKLPPGPIPPGEAAGITAEFRPKAPKPVVTDLVVFETSSAAQPEVLVYVYGSVREFKFQ